MLDSLEHLLPQQSWLGPFLLRVSLCALIILIARRLLAWRWGAQIRRLLWMILIVRCLVPWTQPIQYHPAGLLPSKPNQVTLDTPRIISESIPIDTKPNRSNQRAVVTQDKKPAIKQTSVSSVHIIIILWLLGAFTVFTMAVTLNRRMIRRCTTNTVPVPAWVLEIYQSCRTQLQMRKHPVLTVSPHSTSPCLVGVVKPRILLPGKLLKDTSACEMRHILLHECIHYQQGDIWYAWLWTLTLAIHWFNPLLWWAGRRLSQDCEAACDERVLAVLKPDKRISYGQSLLALAQRLRPRDVMQPGFSCIVERSNKLERRLTMIKNYHTRRVPVAGKLVLILFALWVLTGYAQQEEQVPIPLEKAELMGRVEDFLMRNLKEATLRRSLEWGSVETSDQGHRSIRYRYELLSADQEYRIVHQVFVFDAHGHYLGHETASPFPFLGSFDTVDLDGGLTWQEATALTDHTWFAGHFAERSDERWYLLDVSGDRTYLFYIDAEFGSGKYTADPVFELFEQIGEGSESILSDHANWNMGDSIVYRPERSTVVYIRLRSDNPGNTSFALSFTELDGQVEIPEEEPEDEPEEEPEEQGAKITMHPVSYFFADNSLDYQPIRTPTEFASRKFDLSAIGLAKDEVYLYIKLEYRSRTEAPVGVRLAGNSSDLVWCPDRGTEVGKNLLIVQLEIEKVLAYPDPICVEIGDERSVVVEKDVVDDFLR